MSEALISTTGLSLKHGNRSILSDVSFAIEKAEIVTIVGPNGSGKSSFLKCLIGAQKPTSGQIRRKKGLRIGYVPQKLTIDPTLPMRVERFLDLAENSKSDRAEVEALLGIAAYGGQQISELSGGQLQRVLLAHALIGKPDLLVLDEAAQGLDQPAVAGFYQLIEDLRKKLGCAILMVSHDLHVVMSASDRVICLNGHVCCEGTPTIVSAAPEYRQLFGHGTAGALALYRHVHDHKHDHAHDHGHADHD